MIIDKPLNIYGRCIPNRVVFQPMEGCDALPSGAPGELTLRRYMRFASGGAAIIWVEAIAVTLEGRANPRQLYINKKNVSAFSAMLAAIRKRAKEEMGINPIIVAQLTHSGRFSKPYGTPKPLVAYRNELWEKDAAQLDYKVLSDTYCDELVVTFGTASRLAEEAGFDGIDIKCCHGYLLNEFLSAKTRKGKYGGDLKGRVRLYCACIDEVRQSVSRDVFVTTRLNAADCFPYPYGFGVDSNNMIDLTETKIILADIKEKGIEMVNITLGNPYLIPHFNRPAVNTLENGEIGMERIRNVTRELQLCSPGQKMVLSGLSYPGDKCISYANLLLEEKTASLAGFGRMIFAYPRFYADYLKGGSIDKNKCCIKCSKCSELMRAGSVTGCPVRDKEVYMPLYKKHVLKMEI